MNIFQEIRGDSHYRQVMLSAITGAGSKAITGAIGLYTVTLAISYLGKEQYGLWMTLVGVVAWMQLSHFGLLNGLPIALSEAYGKEDRKLIVEYVVAGFYASLVICLLGCLASVALAPLINVGYLLDIRNPVLSETARTSLMFILIGFFVSIPFAVIQKVLYSFHLNHFNNHYSAGYSIINLVVLYLCVKSGVRLEYVILLTSLIPLSANVGLILVLYRRFPWLSFSIRHFRFRRVVRVARSSLWIFVFQIGALCVNQLVYVIIARKGGLDMVADFSIIYRIYLFVYGIGATLTIQFYPIIGSLWVKQQYQWIRRAVIRAIFVQVAVVSVISIPLLVDGNYLIKLWTTKELSYAMSEPAWLIFVAFMMVTSIGSVLSETLTILDVVRPQVVVVYANALLLNTVLYLLIESYKLDAVFIALLVGSIWGTLGSLVIYLYKNARQQNEVSYESSF